MTPFAADESPGALMRHAVLAAAGSAALAALSFYVGGGGLLPSLWLPNALLVALSVARRPLPAALLIMSGQAAVALISLALQVPPATVAVFAVAHTLTCVIARELLQRFGLLTARTIELGTAGLHWVGAAVIAPAAGALVASAALSTSGAAGFAPTVVFWWLREAGGMTFLLPAAVLFGFPGGLWKLKRTHPVEIAILLGGTPLAVAGALAYTPFPFVLMAMLPLAAGVRLGLAGTSLTGLLGLVAYATAVHRLHFDLAEAHSEPLWNVLGPLLALTPASLVATLFEQTEGQRAAARRSEAFVRSAMRHSPTGFALVAPDGRWLEVNGAFCQLLQRDEAALLRTRLEAITHPDDIAEDAHLRARLDAGEIESFQREKRFVRGDGSHVAALLAMSVVRDKRGRPAYYVLQVVDISAQRAARERQRRATDQLQRVLEGSDDGFWDWKIRRGEVTFSPRWTLMLGYLQNELAASIDTWLNLMHPEDRPRFEVACDEHFAGKSERMDVEMRMRHKDGHWVWVQCRGRVYARGTDRSPLRMAGTHSDISARRRVEQLKAELISTISHELRTPLTSIRGSLALLVDDPASLPPDAQMLVTIAYRNCERLVLLVNDIIDMEAIDSGHLSMSAAPVDLTAVVHEAADTHRHYGRDRHVSIAVDLPPSASALADPDRLLQVLSNLLSNAIKFSPERGVVQVSVVDANGAWRIEVRDHGPGVPENFRNRLFDRFAQADASDTRQRGGSGLGLSIAKALTERMGGRIGFALPADDRGGALFWIELPRVTQTADIEL